jgi:hypothetical protein
MALTNVIAYFAFTRSYSLNFFKHASSFHFLDWHSKSNLSISRRVLLNINERCVWRPRPSVRDPVCATGLLPDFYEAWYMETLQNLIRNRVFRENLESDNLSFFKFRN